MIGKVLVLWKIHSFWLSADLLGGIDQQEPGVGWVHLRGIIIVGNTEREVGTWNRKITARPPEKQR